MARALTARQREILHYIISYVQDEGYPPTIAEIGEQFKIASTNGVNDHLLALERKGFIQRCSKARGIRIMEKAALETRPQPQQQAEVGMLPLVGRVAAGAPLLAEENVEDMVPVPAHLAQRRAFCLRVTGDSMIDDGILDGDIIVVDQEQLARAGDVVVALIDEDEATVKRFRPQGDIVELIPANATMQPMRYRADQVHLQGVVVALQRFMS